MPTLQPDRAESARWKSFSLFRRRVLRRVLALAVGCGVAIALGEGALRVVLFGGGSAGWNLRNPARYTDYQTDEDYYKLQKRWRGGQGSVPDGRRHPMLGWVSEALDSTTLEHRVTPDERRRVLLYGDSYAHGVTRAGTRFEDWFTRSQLDSTCCFLNYGVPGYGLDQIALLIDETIDDHAASSPVVLVGVFVDDDLDRCAMRMRWFPKPQFQLDGTTLRLNGTPVPTVSEYIEQNPLEIRSYLARLILHDARIVQATVRAGLAGAAARDAETAALARALVRKIHGDLQARGLEPIFVLFEGEERTAGEQDTRDWRLDALLATLEELEAPHLRTRRIIRDDARGSGKPVHAYFGHGGDLSNHFNELGNEVAFRAIVDAVEGRYDLAR